ncbi:hypothetical protein B0T26DRAFT_756792 [Lasiosphaeria miniovina]|uniref:RRM domain-containing protein n=1 Tax=Lasiosphaeria miniovina TaxID=1954250 RepID=A0AA39ZTB2_9PEZI|nr:uncharacterized protein B0T26DRAFT_756792 [Lasiosphaeria miniovina]KAK0703226.1 hypothetical protein B0T26DRAFT_756792 [Lasiosphaeria miniovina]
MATTAMDYENANGNRFDSESPQRGRDQPASTQCASTQPALPSNKGAPRYDRDRSTSPRRDDRHESSRRRSMSPNGNDRYSAPSKNDGGSKDDDGAINPGSNLFVTGIHPRLEEAEVTRLFEKYGEVEKCQIIKGSHTRESRGFGFVKMVTSDMADAAKDGLQGEVIEGRTLSIEKARRARPRTPTPGKSFGPPKREPGRGGRFDDRRRGGSGGGGYGGRDDSYRGSYRGGRDDRGYNRGFDRGGSDRGYDRNYRDDRGYDRGYQREDRGYDRRDRNNSYGGGGYIDRYIGAGGSTGGREDRGERYGGRGRGGADDRRAPGYDRERGDYRGGDRDTRPPRDAAPSAGGYGDSALRGEAREPYGAR